MIDIMEWSRKIINAIMIKKNDNRYLYHIKITFNPNPLNYDGMDKVLMELIEVNQRGKTDKVLMTTLQSYCFNIEEAVTEMTKLIKPLVSL